MNGTVGDRLRSLADRADAAGDAISAKAAEFVEDLIGKLENALAAIENGTEPEGEPAETDLPPATEQEVIESEDSEPEAEPEPGAGPGAGADAG